MAVSGSAYASRTPEVRQRAIPGTVPDEASLLTRTEPGHFALPPRVRSRRPRNGSAWYLEIPRFGACFHAHRDLPLCFAGSTATALFLVGDTRTRVLLEEDSGTLCIAAGVAVPVAGVFLVTTS